VDPLTAPRPAGNTTSTGRITVKKKNPINGHLEKLKLPWNLCTPLHRDSRAPPWIIYRERALLSRCPVCRVRVKVRRDLDPHWCLPALKSKAASLPSFAFGEREALFYFYRPNSHAVFATDFCKTLWLTSPSRNIAQLCDCGALGLAVFTPR
jgi:hypothetical protein